MAQISDENSEFHAPDSSAPPYGAPPADGISTAVASAPASPLPAKAGLPAQLQDLTDRARGYIEAATSANTRRAYASDWKHFAAWCRRQNLSPLPPSPEIVGLYITAYASGTAERGGKPTTGRPSNGASPSSVGTARNAAAKNWTARTGRSPP